MNAESLQTLMGMLTFKRPAGSKSERHFIDAYVTPLGVKFDQFGNGWIKITNGENESVVLWSTHTDSVHRTGGRQKLQFKQGVISLAPDSKSNCLGADNAAGVWLLREMILARVPGLYLFHRQEEYGGIGSRWIAANAPEMLTGIQTAIAFDRRGKESVITYQANGRSCSDQFAESLSKAIGLSHKKDDTGLFTDTANYTNLIGECTNVSVGTSHEHQANESLDTEYLFALRDKMLQFAESELVYSRKPGEIEKTDYTNHYATAWEIDQFENKGGHKQDYSWDLEQLVFDYPRETADYLEGMGINALDLMEYIAAIHKNRKAS